MDTPALLTACVTHFTEVVGTLLDAPATLAAAQPPDSASGWSIPIVVSGKVRGRLTLGLTTAAAERLTQLVTGMSDVPPEAAVRDTLAELCGQACGALSQTPLAAGLRFEVQSPATGPFTPGGHGAGFVATAGDCTLPLAAWGDLQTDLPPVQDSEDPNNLEVILDIDLPITVRFGETDMTLLALSRLGPGSLIDLGRSPDEPVDVLANGRLIARGEVVSVAGNYGVRVLEVASAGERLRTVPVQGRL